MNKREFEKMMWKKHDEEYFEDVIDYAWNLINKPQASELPSDAEKPKTAIQMAQEEVRKKMFIPDDVIEK